MPWLPPLQFTPFAKIDGSLAALQHPAPHEILSTKKFEFQFDRYWRAAAVQIGAQNHVY
jgi:hypothetical protein